MGPDNNMVFLWPKVLWPVFCGQRCCGRFFVAKGVVAGFLWQNCK